MSKKSPIVDLSRTSDCDGWSIGGVDCCMNSSSSRDQRRDCNRNDSTLASYVDCWLSLRFFNKISINFKTQIYVPITTFVQFSASVWFILCSLSNDIVGISATIDGATGRSAFAIRRHIGHGYSPRLTRRLICCNRSSCNNNSNHHQSRFSDQSYLLATFAYTHDDNRREYDANMVSRRF